VKVRVQLLQGKMRDSDVISAVAGAVAVAVAVAVAPTMNKVREIRVREGWGDCLLWWCEAATAM
jgi:hypothetical protein